MASIYNAGFTKSYALGPGTATDASGQLKDQKAFMSALSKNTNPDVVSQIYTGNK